MERSETFRTFPTNPACGTLIKAVAGCSPVRQLSTTGVRRWRHGQKLMLCWFRTNHQPSKPGAFREARPTIPTSQVRVESGQRPCPKPHGPTPTGNHPRRHGKQTSRRQRWEKKTESRGPMTATERKGSRCVGVSRPVDSEADVGLQIRHVAPRTRRPWVGFLQAAVRISPTEFPRGHVGRFWDRETAKKLLHTSK